jgi:tetratricopeptide (TPR) repeat protein
MLPSFSDSALKYVSSAYTKALTFNYTKGLGDACRQYANIYFWRPTIMNAGKTDCEAESGKYYREAIGWYEKIADNNGLGFCYYGLGNIIFMKDFETGKKTYDLSMKHFQKSGNNIMIAELTDRYGLYYYLTDDVEKCFVYIKKALNLKKQLNDYRGITFSYYNLGLLYQFADDMETSLDYYKKTLKVATEQSVKWNEIYMHIGSIYMWTYRLDSAEYYFRKLLSLTPGFARAQAAYGQLCMMRKEYHQGITYLQQALAYFRKTGDWQTPWALVDLAKCYAGLKQYSSAFEFGKECAAEAAKYEIHNQHILQYLYEMYAGIYENLGRQDSSNWYFRKQITLRDSIRQSESQRKQKNQMAMYKIAAREELQQSRIDLLNRDNQIKQQQLEKEALMKKILIGGIILLILISVIIFRNILLKRRNEKHLREITENELQLEKLEAQKIKAELQQQATELEMQALRAQMNPHFIFNSLNSINRFILQNNKEMASAYLTKFSRLVRLILQNSQATLIPLESELESLELYLELEAVRFDHQFDYKINIETDLDISMVKVPPLIIQPYAENAIWHGLMHKEEKGHLEIDLFIQDDILYCKITDDGIGRKKATELKSKSAENHKSMGMRITADRIAILQKNKQPGSHIIIKDLVLPDGTAAGTEVVLKIPLIY